MTTEIKHPTHVCASINKDGKNRRERFIERNRDGNWVEFRTRPGEWDGQTGESMRNSDWDYYLVDIRAITQEDLKKYWAKDLREAKLTKIHAERDVEKAKQSLQQMQESLDCCNDWITWTEAHMDSLAADPN